MQLFHRSRAEHKDHDTPYSCPPPSGLLEEIELAKREMNDAYNHFQSASDPDLIDCYIYEQNAVMTRYRYLLQQAAGLSAVRLSPEELASEDPALEELPSGEFSSAKPVSAKQTAVG